MIRQSLAEPQVNALLGRLVVGTIVATVLLLATLAGRGIYSNAQRAQAANALKADKEAIRQAMDTLDRSRSVPTVGGVEGMAAVNAFQRYFIERAAASGCVVREVVASPDAQPYVSRFEKDTPPNDDSQLGFKSVLIGSPTEILATLRGLVDCPIPFEFDTATFRRASVDGGHSVIELALELRVLAKGGSA